MTPQEIKALREDSKNYRFNGWFYHCPQDPYVIVPKRRPWMGVTFNFGHPKVWTVFFYSVFAAVVPVLFFLYLVMVNDWPVWIFNLAFAIHIILFALWAYKEGREATPE